MKAVVFKEQGSPDILKWDEIDDILPGEKDVVVDIKATSLNHLDLWVRRGIPGIPMPMIPGSDGAGIIIETGSAVKKVRVGDRVVIQPLTYCGTCDSCNAGKENFCRDFGIFGETEWGTNREHMTVNEKNVYPIPDNMDFPTAAAFPLVSETAYTMLHDRGRIEAGETVFIWGASSGIGHIAVQLAKHAGCRVITTAGSEEKVAFASSLGADTILNYKKDDIISAVKDLTDGKGVDLVFEHVGTTTWKTSLRILGRGGRIVTCGATTGAKVVVDLRHLFMKQQAIIGSTMGSVSSFEIMLGLVSNGDIIPKISRSFPMDDASKAHQFLEDGNQMGKIILERP